MDKLDKLGKLDKLDKLDKAIVIGCDKNQEWLIPWWYFYILGFWWHI
jgi:hypothetical protein